MTDLFEESERNLQALLDWYAKREPSTLNEATTRLHLVDRLFFECLGWQREDCTAEERLDARYIDYSFRCPQCLFIVEAKREGVHFELPTGSRNLTREIRFFAKHHPDVFDAIRQAMEYCQAHGTPFGAVCNGHQLIAFLASRTDGRPPLEGKALVFGSLQTLAANFLHAWQCISKPGIISSRLSLELHDTTEPPLPNKLAATILDYPGLRRRNELQTDLQILSELLIEGIVAPDDADEEKRFLEKCYTQSGSLSQCASVSKDILRARYSALFEETLGGPSITPATTTKGLHPALFAETLTRRPILLLGDRGVGKTIFIRHLQYIDAADLLSDAIVIYIDFGTKPTLVEDLRRFVAEEVRLQLLDRYDVDIYERNFVRGVLHLAIQRFERGIYADLRDRSPEAYESKLLDFMASESADTDRYLQQCLNHISKGRRKQVVVFLDNVDQRPYQFQEDVFLIGQTMSQNWPVTVFISVRPETFHRSRLSGTLGAYHSRAFTIAPPRIDHVLGKRLRYGISLLKRGFEVGRPRHGVFVEADSLSDYLKVLESSFRHSKHLIPFLDNMCGGNVRLALDFLRQFISSGHVDTAKILDIYRKSGLYTVPLHEFLRAVIYADHNYYFPAASEIVNVFDLSRPDGKEHFLACILLAQMDRWAQNSTTEGFVDFKTINDYLQPLAFTPLQIRTLLPRLLAHNLLESAVKSAEPDENARQSHLRITSIGAYYFKVLATQFAYLDAIIVDTPILDDQYRLQITDVDTLAERLARVELFLQYLHSQWLPLSDQQLAFDWKHAKQASLRDIRSIRHRIQMSADIRAHQSPLAR
jgi:hypothetical protein